MGYVFPLPPPPPFLSMNVVGARGPSQPRANYGLRSRKRRIIVVWVRRILWRRWWQRTSPMGLWLLCREGRRWLALGVDWVDISNSVVCLPLQGFWALLLWSPSSTLGRGEGCLKALRHTNGVVTSWKHVPPFQEYFIQETVITFSWWWPPGMGQARDWWKDVGAGMLTSISHVKLFFFSNEEYLTPFEMAQQQQVLIWVPWRWCDKLCWPMRRVRWALQ